MEIMTDTKEVGNITKRESVKCAVRTKNRSISSALTLEGSALDKSLLAYTAGLSFPPLSWFLSV